MKFCGSFPHRSPQNARPCLWGKWGDFPSASGRLPPLRRHLCRSPCRLVTHPWARGRGWTGLCSPPCPSWAVSCWRAGTASCSFIHTCIQPQARSRAGAQQKVPSEAGEGAVQSLVVLLFGRSVVSHSSATPRTVAAWLLPFMGFYRQESWTRLPCPSPGDLSDPADEPVSPALAGGFLPLRHQCSVLVRNKPQCPLEGVLVSFPWHRGLLAGTPAHRTSLPASSLLLEAT